MDLVVDLKRRQTINNIVVLPIISQQDEYILVLAPFQ
jgi:hypothetical protein